MTKDTLAAKERARTLFHERRDLHTNEHDFAFLDGYDAGQASRWIPVSGGEPPHAGPWQVTYPTINGELESGFDFFDGARGWRYFRGVVAYAPILSPYQQEEA